MFTWSYFKFTVICWSKTNHFISGITLCWRLEGNFMQINLNVFQTLWVEEEHLNRPWPLWATSSVEFSCWVETQLQHSISNTWSHSRQIDWAVGRKTGRHTGTYWWYCSGCRWTVQDRVWRSTLLLHCEANRFLYRPQTDHNTNLQTDRQRDRQSDQ